MGVSLTTSPTLIDHYTAVILSAQDFFSFGSNMPGRSFNQNSYKYGFNGKENDKETGYQDYGMRMYNPKLARFFSVDPFVRTFSYFSPYQYAANDVIRCIDIEGAESGVVIWSPWVRDKVEPAIKNKDYKLANTWLNYSRVHNWVDDSGKPSTFYKDLAKKLGVTYEIPENRAVTDLVLENDDPYYKRLYGDAKDGGGWIKVEFYNIQIDGFELVGYIPLRKINDDGKLKMYDINSDVFWDTEPIILNSEWKAAIESRLENLIIDKIKGIFKADIDDPTELLNNKMEIQIKGRLRALGNNSSIIVPERDLATDEVVKIHSYTYIVNDNGSEEFKHSVLEMTPGLE